MFRTNFTGPHAQAPSLTDVERLLSELDKWRQRAPRKQDSRSFPQQNPDRVQANYLQAVLLLIRPILTGDSMNPDLIGLCVNFAADACEVSYTFILIFLLLLWKRFADCLPECEGPQFESPDTTGPYYSVPLFLRRDYVTAVSCNQTNHVNTKASSSGH